MNMNLSTAIYRESDNELLGYVKQTGEQWDALTIFGYAFATALSEADARAIVVNKGLEVLMGTWEYYNDTIGEWLGCALLEAAPNRVKIAELDGPYPDPNRTQVLTQDLGTKLRR